MKNLFVLIIVLLQAATTSAAGESDVRHPAMQNPIENSGSELGSYTFTSQKGQVKTSVQCIDGYKFAVVSMVGHQSTPGPAVDIIQIYESSAQSAIPAKCSTSSK